MTTKSKKIETYKGHRAGSKKAAVHKCFDGHGRKRAISYGKMRGLKESTLLQWVRTWEREAKKADVSGETPADQPYERVLDGRGLLLKERIRAERLADLLRRWTGSDWQVSSYSNFDRTSDDNRAVLYKRENA